MYDLAGKVAIVTGAGGNRGFGRAIATRLAREGADVVVLDKFTVLPRDEELTGDWEGIDSIVDEIKAFGRQALAITCDITQSDEVDKMVKETLDKFGQIDILVNNAGVEAQATIDSISNEVWDANLSVNLTGTFFCSRAVAREMMKRGQGGKIINIASTFAKAIMAVGRIGYAASKFGVVGLTQSLALELAPHSINVNSVCPGPADTGLASEFFKTEAWHKGITEGEIRSQVYDQLASTIPLRRLTTPEDIANVVAFLASKEADFITGQSINVSGGVLMAH